MFALILLLSLIAGAEDVKVLSLGDIKRYAINHNFALKAEGAGVEEVKAQLGQRRSAFFPRMALVAGPEMENDRLTKRSNTMGYMEGSWNLFRGAADRIQVDAAQLNVKIAESGFRRAQFELELEVEDLFYRHLSQSASVQFYTEAIELNDRHRQLLRRKRESGMASQADMMEFELRDSYLRSELAQIQQMREEARIGLTRLMGPDIGFFEPQGALPHVHLKAPLKVFMGRINTTSDVVKAAALRSATGALDSKMARSAWFPTVDLISRYGNLPQDLELQNPAFQAALMLRWEFFSGFETTAKVAETKARANRLENEFRAKLLSAMSEAEVSYTRLLSLQERVHVEERNQKNASSYYRAVLDEYRRGVKNGVDLKVAEEAFLVAKTRALDFRYRFLSDKIQLERAVGLMIETEVHKDN